MHHLVHLDHGLGTIAQGDAEGCGAIFLGHDGISQLGAQIFQRQLAQLGGLVDLQNQCVLHHLLEVALVTTQDAVDVGRAEEHALAQCHLFLGRQACGLGGLGVLRRGLRNLGGLGVLHRCGLRGSGGLGGLGGLGVGSGSSHDDFLSVVASR